MQNFRIIDTQKNVGYIPIVEDHNTYLIGWMNFTHDLSKAMRASCFQNLLLLLLFMKNHSSDIDAAKLDWLAGACDPAYWKWTRWTKPSVRVYITEFFMPSRPNNSTKLLETIFLIVLIS